MRNERSDGVATLLASTKQVNSKLQQLRNRSNKLEKQLDAVSLDFISASEPYVSMRSELHRVRQEIQAIEKTGDRGPTIAVTLDDYGSTLVRRALHEGFGEIAADVVNAALAFMLGEEEDHYAEDEVAAAIERRKNPPSPQSRKGDAADA